MKYAVHQMYTCAIAPTTRALFAVVSDKQEQSQLVYSRGFCMTS